jgi:hypothetical protein
VEREKRKWNVLLAGATAEMVILATVLCYVPASSALVAIEPAYTMKEAIIRERRNLPLSTSLLTHWYAALVHCV